MTTKDRDMTSKTNAENAVELYYPSRPKQQYILPCHNSIGNTKEKDKTMEMDIVDKTPPSKQMVYPDEQLTINLATSNI